MYFSKMYLAHEAYGAKTVRMFFSWRECQALIETGEFKYKGFTSVSQGAKWLDSHDVSYPQGMYVLVDNGEICAYLDKAEANKHFVEAWRAGRWIKAIKGHMVCAEKNAPDFVLVKSQNYRCGYWYVYQGTKQACKAAADKWQKENPDPRWGYGYRCEQNKNNASGRWVFEDYYLGTD